MSRRPSIQRPSTLDRFSVDRFFRSRFCQRPFGLRPVCVRPGLSRRVPVALAILLVILVGPQSPLAGQATDAPDSRFTNPCDRSPLLNSALVPDALLPGPDGVIPELSPISLRDLDEDDLLRAQQNLTAATLQRPVCADDAMALAALSVALKDRDGLLRARDALQSAENAATPERPMPASVWLWRARIEAALGGARGGEFAQRAITIGTQPSSAALSAARAAWARGQDNVAVAAYRQGLIALADGGPMDPWLGDLGPLIRDEEAQRLGGLDNVAAVNWLVDFWQRRAAEAGVSLEERLTEHYRRVRYVHENYCRTCIVRTTPDPVIPYGRVAMGLDERGTFYLMHGEPTRSASTDGNSLPPNEAWFYERPEPEPDLMLHFAVVEPRNGFVIMENPLSVINPVLDPLEVDSTQMGDLPPGVRPNCIGETCRGRYNPDFERYLIDLSRLDPRYQPVAQRYRRSDRLGQNSQSNFVIGGPLQNERSFEMQAREMLEWARERDSFVPAGAELVDVPIRVYTFRSPEGDTEIVFAAGPLPAPDSEDAAPRPVLLRADVSLVDDAGANPTQGAVALSPDDAAGVVVVPLTVDRPGRFTHRIAFRTGPGARDSIAVLAGGEVEVPDFGRPALTLSDLVLGQGAAPNFERGGSALQLRPDGVFRAGEELVLYHEIYDLLPGEPYTTTIRVERASGEGVWGRISGFFGGGGEALPELSFDGEAPAGRLVQRSYSIALGALETGRYRLVVDVQGQGRENRREVRFELR